MEKTEFKIARVEDLVNEEFLTKALNTKYAEEVNSLIKLLDDYPVVEDEETNTIVREKRAELKKLLDSIELERKVVVTPFNEAVSSINIVFKEFLKQGDLSLNKVANRILKFQTDEAEKIKANQNEIISTADALLEKHKGFIADLQRKAEQVFAMVFGGKYTSVEGVIEYSSRPTEENDLDALRTFLEDKYPDHSMFEEICDYSEALLKLFFEMIDFQRIHIGEERLKEGQSLIKSVTQNNEYANEMKEKAEEIFNLANKYAYKLHKTTLKDYEKAISEKLKGTRKTWTYTVSNNLLIPEKFKSIDETKIKNFMKLKKEEIEENPDILPGIHFFQKRSVYGD